MTTLAPPPAVTSYANAVRDHLAGLDAETLDELTGGLEADLAEALAERDPDGGATDLAGVTAVFGSPGAYAEELRTAAGVELPEDVAKSARPGARDLLRRVRADARATWEAQRARYAWLRWVSDFLVSLRPVWWLARGWVIFMCFTGMNVRAPLGHGTYQHAALLVLVLVSVLWGQRQIGQQKWVRRAGLAASAITALLLLPPFLVSLGYQLGGASGYAGSSSESYSDGYRTGHMEGMNEGRQQAMDWYGADSTSLTGPTNLFVYGADGQPIENAQILDQDGRSVILVNPANQLPWGEFPEDGYDWDENDVPLNALAGATVPLNVYPYSFVPADAVGISGSGAGAPGLVADTTLAITPQWPLGALQSLKPADQATGSAATDGSTGEFIDPEAHEGPTADGSTEPAAEVDPTE